jgi:transposase
VIAGTVIGDARQVFRFAGRGHFASWNGTAPVEVSSGDRKKVYRLSLRGNRRVNHAIHVAAISQIRRQRSDGRAFYERGGRGQDAQGGVAGTQAPDQRRHLAALVADAWQATASPRAREDNRGTTLHPGRPAHTPHTGTSGKPLPACRHHTARRYRRSRPKPAEPNPSATSRAPRGRFEKTPASHLTPTVKRLGMAGDGRGSSG